MGNNNCTLVINTDRQNYTAGETCKGTVYVSVSKNFVQCHSLRVRLKGYESAVVNVHVPDTNHNRHSPNHHGNHGRHSHSFDHNDSFDTDRFESSETVLIHQDHILHNCLPSMHGQGAGLHEGQYEFPFEFVVPHQLPSTLYYKQGQSHCEVRYEVSAYLQLAVSSSNMNPFQRKKYSSKDLRLVIRGNNSMNMINGGGCYPMQMPGGPTSFDNKVPSPVYFPTETERINFWCCFNRGQIRLDAQLSMDEHSSSSNEIHAMHFNSTGGSPTLVPNKAYILSYSISNDSTAVIKSIQMELIQTVTWRAEHEEKKDQKEILKKSMDGKTLGSQVQNGLNAAGGLNSGGSDYVPISPPHDTNSRTNENDYTLGQPTFKFMVPKDAIDTYTGNTIQVQHFLRVKICTVCCMTSPESSLDVHIAHVSAPPALSTEFGGDNTSGTVEIMPPPSAPPMDTSSQSAIPTVFTLPPDWSPQTAEVVALPIATPSAGEDPFIIQATVSTDVEPLASAPLAYSQKTFSEGQNSDIV